MKDLEPVIAQATQKLVRHVLSLEGRIVALEEQIVQQGRKIKAFEEIRQSGLHSLEVTERDRVTTEGGRVDALSPDEFRTELQSEFGATQWAKRLIRESLGKRFRKQKMFS